MAEYQDSNMRLINSNKSKNNSLQYYQQKAQGRWACLFPFVEMAVLPDGKIYYCIESLFRLGFDPDNQSLGDYNQQSLPEIWSGILFQQLRQDLILNQLEKRSVCQNWKSQVIDREVKDEYQIFNTTITEIYTSVY